MKDPKQHRRKNLGQLGWWRSRQSFIGDDDDTDQPDFEKGSWAALIFVLVLIGFGIAMMLALLNQN